MSEEMDSQGEIESSNAAASESAPEATEPQSDGYADAAQNPEVLAVFERVFGDKSETEVAGDEGAEPTVENEAGEGEAEAAEPAPVTPKVSAQRQEASATLPANLLQAARRAGWTPEDAKEFYAANPDLAGKTFTQLQGHFNDLSQRYAQIGQRQMQPQPQLAPWQQQQQRQQPAAPAQPQSAPQNSLDQLFSELDKFAEANGEDITERFIKPLYNELVVPFRQMQAAYEQQRQSTMRSEINNVFSGFGKEYAALYGEKQQSPEQHQARFQVSLLADQIRSGAGLQGQDMTVSEALERAHVLYTANRQQQAVRQQITGAVRKRAASITARPTNRRAPAGAEGKGDSQAAAAVANFWNERGL